MSRKASLFKFLSWSLGLFFIISATCYLFLSKIAPALSIGAGAVILIFFFHHFHEKLWAKSTTQVTKQPFVLWFTGLSGSGKTTIALELLKRFQRQGLTVEHLDGDNIRDIFPQTGFTREDRDQHIKRAGFLASRLEKNGVSVIASFISPYTETRGFVRSICQRFIEVHISTPLAACEKRDVKGLYAKARRGEIKSFTGLDDPYEPPTKPELTIDTCNRSVTEVCDTVENYLRL
jgi:adenylylsulfate kinase